MGVIGFLAGNALKAQGDSKSRAANTRAAPGATPQGAAQPAPGEMLGGGTARSGSMAPPAELRAAPLGMTPAAAAAPDWTHPGEAAFARLRAGGAGAAPGAPPPEADARYLANLYR